MEARSALGTERNREPLADVDLLQTQDLVPQGAEGKQARWSSEPVDAA